MQRTGEEVIKWHVQYITRSCIAPNLTACSVNVHFDDDIVLVRACFSGVCDSVQTTVGMLLGFWLAMDSEKLWIHRNAFMQFFCFLTHAFLCEDILSRIPCLETQEVAENTWYVNLLIFQHYALILRKIQWICFFKSCKEVKRNAEMREFDF
jgi:hypothetical protein